VRQLKKLLERIRRQPKSVRFDEVARVLKSMGYEKRQPQSGSSHWTFRKKGCMPITIPKHEPYVKEVYVKMVIKVLDEKGGAFV